MRFRFQTYLKANKIIMTKKSKFLKVMPTMVFLVKIKGGKQMRDEEEEE